MSSHGKVMNTDGLQMELAALMPGEKQGIEAVNRARAVKELDNVQRKELREEEDLNKKMLIEREVENFTNIFALKCYNGWLKLYDNSAMIVSTWLEGRLGRSYNRHDDQGFGAKAKYGVVSVPPDAVTDFVQRLMKTKIKLAYDNEWVLEFQLGERVSKEEMVRMLHEDELIIDKVNSLVMPKAVLPGLRSSVKMLLEFVHVQVRNQKDSMKEVFLNDLERLAVEMNKRVVATSRGRMKVDDCLEAVGGFVEDMYEGATTMSDIKLITAKQYKEFVDLIKRVEGEQGRAIKRQAVEQAEKRIGATKKKVKV